MPYQLQGFQDINSDTGYDCESTADTIKDARKQAKYLLSNEYMNVCEASCLITKVQVWKLDTLVEEIY